MVRLAECPVHDPAAGENASKPVEILVAESLFPGKMAKLTTRKGLRNSFLEWEP
jgi:hypothetical protein